MRGFTFPVFLLIASLLATSSAYTDELQRMEDEQAERELAEESDGTLRTLGQTCSDAHPCVASLDCIRAPIRRKCFPVRCAEEAAQVLNDAGFDFEAFGQQIMRDANVTKESKMFRPFPGADLTVFNSNTDDFHSVVATIEHSQPAELDLFAAAFEDCTRENDPEASTSGITPYFGASWALGALATYNGDIFWGQGSNDTVGVGYVNHCFGVVLGYEASISGLFGLAFTGTFADLNAGCKQMFPLTSVPPITIQVGFINSCPPTFLIEFTAGASAGAGLPGYTQCTTQAL